jgi:ribulose-bisphosphate carboxylase large chain
MEEMYRRAEFAKELGSVIVMVDLIIGWTAIQSISGMVPAERHDPAHAPRRPRHLHAPEEPRHLVPGDRQVARLAGVDHLHCRYRGGQARGRSADRAGLLQRLRETRNEVDLQRGIFFEQDWADLKKVMPVASGGIHAGQMHQLLDLFGDDVVLQFGGGTIGHPMGIQAGATANRVALEAMVLARNEGRTSERGPGHPQAAAKWCKPLEAALETWGNITFNYTSTDTSDFVPTASVSM